MRLIWAFPAGSLERTLGSDCARLHVGFPADHEIVTGFEDVFLTIGIAAFFAEAYDNPAISLRWKGWRREIQLHRQLTADLLQYIRREVLRLWTAIANRGKQ
jgi:hypothetical protein